MRRRWTFEFKVAVPVEPGALWAREHLEPAVMAVHRHLARAVTFLAPIAATM